LFFVTVIVDKSSWHQNEKEKFEKDILFFSLNLWAVKFHINLGWITIDEGFDQRERDRHKRVG